MPPGRRRPTCSGLFFSVRHSSLPYPLRPAPGGRPASTTSPCHPDSCMRLPRGAPVSASMRRTWPLSRSRRPMPDSSSVGTSRTRSPGGGGISAGRFSIRPRNPRRSCGTTSSSSPVQGPGTCSAPGTPGLRMVASSSPVARRPTRLQKEGISGAPGSRSKFPRRLRSWGRWG